MGCVDGGALELEGGGELQCLLLAECWRLERRKVSERRLEEREPSKRRGIEGRS